MTVRPGRVLTLAGPEVGAEKMRLRLPIRGPRLPAVPGRHAVARWSACGCIFTRGDDRAASRAPPSSPPLSGAHTRRLADARATDVLPGRRRLRQRHTSAEGEHGAGGNRVERFLAASSVRACWWRRGRSSNLSRGRTEPRVTSYSPRHRKRMSGNRFPACSAAPTGPAGVRGPQSTPQSQALIKDVGSWLLGVEFDSVRS